MDERRLWVDRPERWLDGREERPPWLPDRELVPPDRCEAACRSLPLRLGPWGRLLLLLERPEPEVSSLPLRLLEDLEEEAGALRRLPVSP